MKLPTFFLLLSILTSFATSPAAGPAPEATVNDFFHYLLKPKQDITKDSAAQSRWLGKDVRQAMTAAVAGSNKAAKAHAGEQIDGVDNGTFLAAWDPPTTFQVTGVKTTPPTAKVELLYTWGPKTEYPGETRKVTVLLALEEGAWQVTDIQSHKSKFSPESTLLGDLRKIAKQH